MRSIFHRCVTLGFILSALSIWYLFSSDAEQRYEGSFPFLGNVNQISLFLSRNYSGNISQNFQDEYFKRVLNVFRFISTDRKIKKSIAALNIIPKFLLISNAKSDIYWRNQLRHIYENECPFPCTYTRDAREAKYVDAILIHLDSFDTHKSVKKYLPERNIKIPWVMLTFESPLMANKFIDIKYEDFNNVFNRTMTYRKDADVIVNHGFVVSKEDANLLPSNWCVPLIYNISSQIIHKQNITIVAAFISNCDDKSGRLKYISKLQRYINVDIYGHCGILKCGKSMYVGQNYIAHTDECLRKVGTSYMFYLAFENSFCKDYGSEKIYNLMHYPIVPIVYGGINYEEILPLNSYINAADYSPSKLANYIKYLASHTDEYDKYLEWRNHYVPSTVGGERIMCDLCTRLYDPKFYKHKVIKNFTKWYVADSKCFKYNT